MDRLEEYAAQNNVPIIQKDGILFIQKYIKENKIKNILEIGTAIGYSAINMASVDKGIKITTIEKNEAMYKEALKNIEIFHMEGQITVILGDALDIATRERFDLIFIDAAKAQYIKFFEKYKHNLVPHGVIISDNLNFHGLTDNIDSIESSNLKALVRKINNYKSFLKENKEFETEFLDIGDGISVSKGGL